VASRTPHPCRHLTRPRWLRHATWPVRRLAGGRLARRLVRWTRSRYLAYLAALPPMDALGPWPMTFEARNLPRGSALLLTGCVAACFFSGTNRAMAALLALAGVRVTVASEGPCCGALALHLGDAERARSCAREVLEHPDARGVDWVVTTAAGCGAFVREIDQ